MSDNKLPPIDVDASSSRFKTEAEWLKHLEKYKKQNPEKYIAKERVGDFERQAKLLGFGKPEKKAPEKVEDPELGNVPFCSQCDSKGVRHKANCPSKK